MNELQNPPAASITRQDRLPPVRVRLLQPDAYNEQTCPPDGEIKDWEARLNKALGTVSPDFVKASLLQLQGAARSPYGTISETAINAALAMIEAARAGGSARPSDGLYSCSSNVRTREDGQWIWNGTENCGARFNCGSFNENFCDANGSPAAVCNGGQQFVRVEHVHVNDGGQAVIGNVKK